MTIHPTLAVAHRPMPATALPDGPLADLFALEGAMLRLARNEELYGEAEPAEHAYRVVSGTVRTVRFTADGRRQIGGFLRAGDVFGLEAGETYRFGVEAVTEATVMMVGRARVLEAAGRDLGVARALLALASTALAQADDHRMLLTRRGADERVAAFLLAAAGRAGAGTFDLPMSRQEIADHLGLTIETVSRTMTQFERDRIIAMHGARQIELRRRQALADLAAGTH